MNSRFSFLRFFNGYRIRGNTCLRTVFGHTESASVYWFRKSGRCLFRLSAFILVLVLSVDKLLGCSLDLRLDRFLDLRVLTGDCIFSASCVDLLLLFENFLPFTSVDISGVFRFDLFRDELLERAAIAPELERVFGLLRCIGVLPLESSSIFKLESFHGGEIVFNHKYLSKFLLS